MIEPKTTIKLTEATSLKSNKRFKVAFSFPGEYRDMVQQIAERLATIFTENGVLYDMFHRAEFARPNLDTHLQNLYKNESELIVVFICTAYNEKEWCGIEWRAIRELLNSKKNDNRIMFIKCGKGTVDGVFGTIDGYIDSSEVSTTDIINDIIKRYSALDNADSLNIELENDEFNNKIKIVINGSVEEFVGKVIDIKHWVERSPVISTVAGSLIFKIKSNDLTKYINFNDKFVLSQNVWKVIGIDDTDKQTVIVTCEKELISPNDDMDNKIANKNYIVE